MIRASLLYLIVLALFLSDAASEDAYCRDSSGLYVDWWIISKRSGSTEYLIYSSREASKNQPPRPLSPRFLLTDRETSPFLRTIYDPQPQRNNEAHGKNNLILAWNDQQPHDRQKRPKRPKSTKATKVATKTPPVSIDDPKMMSHYERLQRADEAAKETQLGTGKDMYGSRENMEAAHSKGILSLSVSSIPPSGNGTATAWMSLITHSFPRIPAGAEWQEEAAIKRAFIPENPADFFGSNITGKHSKAQHALCISMKQEVEVRDGEIVFDRAKLDRKRMNLFALLDGLDVIGPSMTLTNYVPWLPRFRIYHQLFDIRDQWSPNPITDKEPIYTLNVARAIRRKQQSAAEDVSLSSHVFPLWPHKSRVIVEEGKIVGKRMAKVPASLRDPGQVHRTRCQVWNAIEGSRKDQDCYVTAILTSTQKHGRRSRGQPLVLKVDFKNSRVTIDTDDFIAARLLPLRDMEVAQTPGGGSKRHVSMVVVYQSWIDHSTLGSHARTILDTERLTLKAWFHNNLATILPCEDGTTILQPSNLHDHSKWFVSYLYGQMGNYQAVAGVTDLNRTNNHTRRKGYEYGRGGMFLFTHSPHLVAFFMSLQPIIEDNSSFTNTPLHFFTERQAALHDDSPIKLVRTVGLNEDGRMLRMKFDNERTLLADAVMLPYYAVPSALEEIMQQERLAVEQWAHQIEQSPGKSTPLALITGSHMPLSPAATPRHSMHAPLPRPVEIIGALMPITVCSSGQISPFTTYQRFNPTGDPAQTPSGAKRRLNFYDDSESPQSKICKLEDMSEEESEGQAKGVDDDNEGETVIEPEFDPEIDPEIESETEDEDENWTRSEDE